MPPTLVPCQDAVPSLGAGVVGGGRCPGAGQGPSRLASGATAPWLAECWTVHLTLKTEDELACLERKSNKTPSVFSPRIRLSQYLGPTQKTVKTTNTADGAGKNGTFLET